MRRVGRLFEKVTDYENLYAAWREVRRGKGDHRSVLAFESNLAVELSRLQAELEAGTYRPRPHRTFEVHDPKTRTIQAPSLRDRVVQHALVRVTRDYIERRLIDQTYACIRGRGTHAASRRFQRYLQATDGRGYVLHLDVRKFFPSIHHDTLVGQIERIFKCQPTLELYERFIRVGGGERGIPIGAVTSQVLANLALNPIDHFAKRGLKLRRYVRYMDDVVVLGEDQDRLRGALQALKEKLAELELTPNPKSRVEPIRGAIDFVGYRHRPGLRLIRKASLYCIRRRLRRRGPTLPRVMSYLSHAKDTASLPTVVRIVAEEAPDHRPAIREWERKHVA